MIEIALIGKYGDRPSIVDDEDGDLATQRWHGERRGKSRTLYVAGGTQSQGARLVSLHRVVLARKLGRPLAAGETVDHINGDGLDNRRQNLRLATHAQNMANRQPAQGSTSRFLGVYFDRWMAARGRKCWRAECRSAGHKYRLGLHATEEDAARAYNDAAQRIHGQFARLNPV